MSLTKKGEIAIIQICRSDVSQPSPKFIFKKIFQTKTSIQMSKISKLKKYVIFVLLFHFVPKIFTSVF